MTIYYLLFLSFSFFYILFSKVTIWGNEKIARACIYGLLIFCILAFRHPSMGGDLGYYCSNGYLSSFQRISSLSFSQVLALPSFLNYEKGYVYFNWLLGLLGDNYQILLIGCAVLSIIPIAFLFYKESPSLELSYIIYLSLQSFMICFSGLRQGIAVGICAIAFLFIQKHDWKKFIALVLLASTFHTSSILFLPAYPLFYINVSKKERWFSVLGIVGCFLFGRSLLPLLSKILKNNVVIKETGAVTYFVIFCFVYIFCFLFANENKKNNGLLNLLFIGCLVLAFTNLHSFVMRAGYYYFTVLPLILPTVLINLQEKNFKLITQIIVIICFAFFSLNSLYNSSWAMAYPYKFFWE